MLSINDQAAVHIGPIGSSKVPKKFIKTIEDALQILAKSMRNDAECNASFIKLSGKKRFRELFDDPNIWLNYDPDNTGRLWGWVIPAGHPKDVVLSQYTLNMGRWTVAATIVHELAHLNGAPGAGSHEAELRVKECRMKSALGPYEPGVTG
ncbi:MAG: hypothetical protein COB51_13330 [Moraxellaceae bacterium]|nr:MAG: hypothetical protein COB51_13330 [Moraxellaceae bacterium]